MNPFVFIDLICILEDRRDARHLSIRKSKVALQFGVIGPNRCQVERVADGCQRAVNLMLQLPQQFLPGKSICLPR